jgi:hypothetical protein
MQGLHRERTTSVKNALMIGIEKAIPAMEGWCCAMQREQVLWS